MQWNGLADRIADTVLGDRFRPGDGHALDGIIHSPVVEDQALWGVNVWDGVSRAPQPARCVFMRNGRVSEVVDASQAVSAGMRVINSSGQTLIPG